MKKIIFILLVAFTFNTQAQADYFTDCTNVAGMEFDGSILYFIQRGTNDGIVSKIDVSEATPTRIDVVTNLTDPVDIVLNGTDLYVLSRLGFLYLVDLTQTNPTPTELLNVTASDYANFRSTHLTLHDNYLYATLIDEGKIVRVPISNPTTSEDVITNLNFPGSTTFIGNEIYYIDFVSGNGNRLFKIDITDTVPNPIIVENLLSNVADIMAVGNYIYSVHWNGTNRISKTDTTASLPTFEEFVVTGIDQLSERIEIYDDQIFVATAAYGGLGGRIQRYVDSSLSVSNNEFKSLQVYPNPTTNFIQISNVEQNTSFEIYNTLGKVIFSGNYTENSKINVSGLSKGTYFLKIKSETKMITKKFIKK